ncbi:MAG: hypothetical protein ACTHJP_03905, partial [Rhodanobacteraceae bacterium]
VVYQLAARLNQSMQIGKLTATFKADKELFPYFLIFAIALFILPLLQHTMDDDAYQIAQAEFYQIYGQLWLVTIDRRLPTITDSTRHNRSFANTRTVPDMPSKYGMSGTRHAECYPMVSRTKLLMSSP